ncbi:MAG: ATP-dependent helicase [Kiritimatiellia bacterium]|jgi:DNA helicase-2/ATP-dependent DNA helicase PcrA|nr:ATP-dependent helicase [Kiritimatiellia bacterium]
MTDYSRLLNPEQCEAATAGEGPLLVLAAAGTGKTRTLVYRVAYLVEQGEPPDGLLLLTFTNRAAREMLERAKEVAGETVGNLWSGTFHHVCNRFLRRFGDRLGYPHDFTILDRDDSHSLIDLCIRETVRNRKEFPKKDVIASLIGSAANRACDIEDVLDSMLTELRVDPMEILRVANLYAEKKRGMGAMDFDDLLVNGLRLLTEHEAVRVFYQSRFRHVLVDEYQDTNLLQARMVDILAGTHGNIMAVGDDFQCIYSWRGADFRNIMEFPKRWPACRMVKLERNYRSVPEVLEVANACIRGNPEQFQKTLRPTRKARNKPQVLFLRDGEEQAAALLALMERYQEDGYRLRDMAVLYRAHYHSIELQIALGRARVPYVITSGIGVFEQAHVKDVLAFLRVCVNRSDRLAFGRLLGLLDGVGEKTVEALWSKIGHTFDAQSPEARARLRAAMRPAAREQWEAIDRLFQAYHSENLDTAGGEIVQRFCDLFYHTLLYRRYDNADKREEDIRELALQIGKSPGVEAFLQEVALLTNVDHAYDGSERETEDRLHLSTVHQAKGLEWPVVFVIWVTEGMFPSSRSVGEAENDAEERRLFYVAVTRAKDELVLCAPGMRRTRDGGVFFCKPSRFIKELPRGLTRERYGNQYA